MENKSTKALFNDLVSRLKIQLGENEKACPTCNGLKLNYIDYGDTASIVNCRSCYNGKIYVCPYCKMENKTSKCTCEAAKAKDIEKIYQKMDEREAELLSKAEVLDYEKYNETNGYYMRDEVVYAKDDFIDYICGLIDDNDGANPIDLGLLPAQMWAIENEPVFSLDIYNIISGLSEDGYEDMLSSLDMKSDKLKQVAILLDEWEKEQGTSLNIYYEDTTRVVDIRKWVDKIMELRG